MAEVDELPINYQDVLLGSTHKPPTRYDNLSQFVRDRIDAVDLTVHELMELAVIELRIGNLHERELSNKYFTEEDVEWP